MRDLRSDRGLGKGLGWSSGVLAIVQEAACWNFYKQVKGPTLLSLQRDRLLCNHQHSCHTLASVMSGLEL